MGEYELELISQHPALPAQNPLLTRISTLNKMNRGKAPFILEIQTLREVRGFENERL